MYIETLEGRRLFATNIPIDPPAPHLPPPPVQIHGPGKRVTGYTDADASNSGANFVTRPSKKSLNPRG